MEAPIWILLGLYLIGAAGSFWVGRYYGIGKADRLYRHEILNSYKRGWDAGFAFLNKIEEERTDAMSGVKIYDYEEGTLEIKTDAIEVTRGGLYEDPDDYRTFIPGYSTYTLDGEPISPERAAEIMKERDGRDQDR